MESNLTFFYGERGGRRRKGSELKEQRRTKKIFRENVSYPDSV
jgi:hypothetical protein